MKMSFKSQRVLEKIQDKEFIDVADIMIICDEDEYLPKNRTNAFGILKILTKQKYLDKVQHGLYKVQKELIKKDLEALK
jgi:hypothetical protein